MRVEEVFESVATSGGGAQMRSRDFLLLASQALCHVPTLPAVAPRSRCGPPSLHRASLCRFHAIGARYIGRRHSVRLIGSRLLNNAPALLWVIPNWRDKLRLFHLRARRDKVTTEARATGGQARTGGRRGRRQNAGHGNGTGKNGESKGKSGDGDGATRHNVSRAPHAKR
eukprot:7381747-Prymnesium_polylepis.1